MGYIGLPTACLFARSGYKVTGVDISKIRVREINTDKINLDEKGFDMLFRKARKNLKAKTSTEPADIFIIAVPTPFRANRKADLSHIENVVLSISKVIKKGNLVVLESTVPPNTSNWIKNTIKKKTGLVPGKDFFVSHCPERAFPGKLLHELVYNDRIIGSDTGMGKKLTAKLYKSFSKGRIFLTGTKTAEFVKLIENAYRNVNIAFANELSALAEKNGLDVYEAIKLANRHPRVDILNPGAGVGGHCIPVDPWFLVTKDTKIIKQSLLTNEKMPLHMVDLLKGGLAKAGKDLRGSNIALLGVSYKPDNADTRCSPALPIIKRLREKGAKVFIHDPFVKNFGHPVSKNIGIVSGKDAVMIVTAHSVYKKISWGALLKKMAKNPVIIDGRNLIAKKPRNAIYMGIGK